MPTATEFTALGAGNGFPFCTPKADVSSFTYKAPMTLAQISKLYWNLYSVTSSATSDSGTVSNPNVDIRESDGVDENPEGYQVGDREPRTRVCSGDSSGYKSTESEESFFIISVVQCFANTTIVRMYNGSTDNESNFIGYGVGDDGTSSDPADPFPNDFASARAGSDFGFGGSGVILLSWAEDPDIAGGAEAWWSSYGNGEPDSIDVTTVSDIPAIKATWIGTNSNEDTSASITGLNFYTY